MPFLVVSAARTRNYRPIYEPVFRNVRILKAGLTGLSDMSYVYIQGYQKVSTRIANNSDIVSSQFLPFSCNEDILKDQAERGRGLASGAYA